MFHILGSLIIVSAFALSVTVIAIMLRAYGEKMLAALAYRGEEQIAPRKARVCRVVPATGRLRVRIDAIAGRTLQAA